MIQNAQSGQVERFNHVHMYHEHPNCAAEVVRGAPWREAFAAWGGGAAAAAPVAGATATRSSIRRRRSPRLPSGASSACPAVSPSTIFPSTQPWPAVASHRRGRLYDHWAVSTANLDVTVARLKREGVKFLEEIDPWGSLRAAMIEGPDRIAIELVEVK